MDGSSSTYITPVSPDPICDASRMRCASPPDKVSALRSSDRYPKPTLLERKGAQRFPESPAAQSLVERRSAAMSKKSAASAPAASRLPDAARRHGCPRLISHGALLCADARRRTRDTVDDSDISPAPRAPPLNPFLDSGAQNWAQYLQISLCG